MNVSRAKHVLTFNTAFCSFPEISTRAKRQKKKREQ
jgi:hypothetical protein